MKSIHVCSAEEEHYKYWRDDHYIHRFLECDGCGSKYKEKLSITALTRPNALNDPDIEWIPG